MIEKKELIEKVNSMAEFNKWCGIKVLSATEGAVEIEIECNSVSWCCKR